MPLRVLAALALAALAARAGELFQTRFGVLDPFPREVGRGRQLVLRGVTKGAYRSAELFIIAPDGRTFPNKDNAVGPTSFVFTVRFEHGLGPYRMEIIAHKTTSTKSVARFTVWHGRARPREEAEAPPPQGAPTPVAIHPRLVESRWLRRLNAFRAKLRLKPVRLNEAVSARAREHAARMARARRRIHKFPPFGGVLDMLQRDGAGPGEWSGPAIGWTRLSTVRPFPRPAPQPPGPRVFNHVVPFVQEDSPRSMDEPVSLERLFESTYVREAAFRICAADPYCTEVGVGVARPRRKITTGAKPKGGLRIRDDSLYYAVCFVQINDKNILAAQEKTYARLLRKARGRDPKLLRRLGMWGRRGKALGLLRGALKDREPGVASAAFDGLLLIDEPRARARLARSAERADTALAGKEYGAAVALWRPYRFVRYDRRIADAARSVAARAARQASAELKVAAALAGPERARRLEALLGRVQGLRIQARVRAALEG